MNSKRKSPELLAGSPDPSGRVRFDDRGNATWETWRGRRLEHPALSIVDEDPPSESAPVNVRGGRLGYNPYESGLVKKKEDQIPKKKDLRALSKWIQAQKALGRKP